MKKKLFAGLATGLFLAGMVGMANATVLTFDASIGNGAVMPQDYGDRVTNTSMGSFSYGDRGGYTPNVTVEYVGGPGNSDGTGTGLSFWGPGFGDLTNVLNNEDDGELLMQINFIADSGFKVILDSFDLGNYGSAKTLARLSIINESASILYSDTNILLPATTDNSHLDFNSKTPFIGQSLSIIIDFTGLGSSNDDVGLDNIQFGQVASDPIPEPATMLLLGTGLVGLAGSRVRRKNRT